MSQNSIRQLLACSRPLSSNRYANVHQPAVPQAHALQISGVCCSCRYAERLDLQPRRVLHGTAASITAFVCQLVGAEQTAASLQWLQYGQRQAQRYSTAGGLIPFSRVDSELLHQKIWTLLMLPLLRAGHNSPKITPAIEVQLHRMRQRHADLCRQLAGKLSASAACCCYTT